MNLKYKHLIIALATVLTIFAQIPEVTAKTATDQVGRLVIIPDDPKRIVSLAPSITEIIYTLDQQHRLKGVTRFSDFPAEALKLPRIGSYVQLDLEKIVALKPDLCFAIKDGNPIAAIRRLESLKIPVYAVNPQNLDSVTETILEIGALLNASKKANILAAKMNSRILKVKSLVAQTTHKPRVFFQIGISPIVAVGTKTFIHELIELAGGKNLSQGPTPYPRFSREQVIALSPDIIIITSMARSTIFETVKKEWSRWKNIPAVTNNRILLVDSNLFDRPTPRIVDGLELLLHLIHPELF